MTPIIDHLNISLIATCIEEDPTLAQLLKIVKSGKKWIPKSSSVKLKKFEPVLNEITMTGFIALLQSERIILPGKLWQKAIKLALKGSHPGKNQIEIWLRAHFFFYGMQSKVVSYVYACIDCKMFVDIKNCQAIDSTQSSHKELGGGSRRSFWDNVIFQLCHCSVEFRA